MTHRSLILAAAIFFLFFLLLTPLGVFNEGISPLAHTGFYSVQRIDAGDDEGYYAYLRSLFIDHDLDFANELNYAHAETFTATGYVFNNWQMGQGAFFFPFFLAAHALTLLAHSLGYPVLPDGYSDPYMIATALASGTVLFAGLLLAAHTASRFFSERIAWMATLGMWLGSPLLYFTFIRQRMAHTLEFFLAAAFLLAWIRFRRSREISLHALMGCLLGYLCLTRALNIAFVAMYVLDQILFVVEEMRKPERETLKSGILRWAGFGVGVLVVLAPQLAAWQALNGVPLPARSVQLGGQGILGFSLPEFLNRGWNLLTGAQWGLAYSMPLACAGGAGLLVACPRKELRPGLLAYLLALAAIVLLYPEGAASYGERHFISALPVLGLGLASLLAGALTTRWGRWSSGPTLGLAVVAQYLMVVQYKVTLPYNHPRFTLEALGPGLNSIVNHPGLLLRSSNVFKVWPMIDFEGWNFRDGMFLVLFPVLQLILVMGAIGLYRRAVRETAGKDRLCPRRVLAGIGTVSLTLLILVVWATPKFSPEQVAERAGWSGTMRRGDVLFQSGHPAEAREKYREAAGQIPEVWTPWFKLALTYPMEGRAEEADRHIRMAWEKNPYDPNLLFFYGAHLLVQGYSKEARERAWDSLRAWPQNERGWDLLAQTYLRGNQSRRAERALRYAVAINPVYGSGHVNLALVYTINRNPRAAAAHLKQALALGMTGPAVDQLKRLYPDP
ncbi:MAG: hypothetical protein COV67_00535 [Nitrospinae bacterium CG11_big_fil_rev_8_21_14_0_20_56_8]|nr:MAG: hypothetical protein COV67_00535 [Nitrospinae bacterium CG11_big_fil_rev_8_21_14_0_20_56_8]